MLNQEEHEKLLERIKQGGVSHSVETTFFGNYKHDTVVQIVIDTLEYYRQQEINKIKRNRNK